MDGSPSTEHRCSPYAKHGPYGAHLGIGLGDQKISPHPNLLVRGGGGLDHNSNHLINGSQVFNIQMSA